MVQLAWPLSPAGSLAVSMKLRQRLLHVMSTQVVHADDWIPGGIVVPGTYSAAAASMVNLWSGSTCHTVTPKFTFRRFPCLCVISEVVFAQLYIAVDWIDPLAFSLAAPI